MNFLAQVADPRLNFWNGANGSQALWIKIALALVFSVLFVIGLSQTPPQARKYVVGLATFLGGFIYIAYWLWPTPIGRQPGTLPNGPVEGVGFFLDDSIQVVGDFSNILGTLLLGLGVFSVLRIHTRKLFKMQADWGFSLVLLVCMLTMVIVGYAEFPSHIGPNASKLQLTANWAPINYAKDFLFDGMLQTMDAAMFSVIAFYILSAAYRAFRIRSIEATILLATALIVILSLMGGVTAIWNSAIDAMSPHIIQHGLPATAVPQPDTGAFIQNFTLDGFANWLQGTLQSSSLRGIDFGVGIGSLAMGMRLWLSLEKGGISQ